MRTLTKEHAALVRIVARHYGATSVRVRRFTNEHDDRIEAVLPAGTAEVYMCRPGEWVACHVWRFVKSERPQWALWDLMETTP